MLEDTIIAVSTPPGMGGLGVVRLSGSEALAIAKRMFRRRNGRRGAIPAGRAILGSVMDPRRGGLVDEAVLTFFRAPHSYTREDVVELSGHGSPVLLEEIIRVGVEEGARRARPGEFTFRAYVNGRVDILQAEAVNDLIRSASLAQARISLRQLGGSLSRTVLGLREGLVHLASGVEAGIEFPEDSLAGGAATHARALEPLIDTLERLVVSYQAGRALGEGVTVAIAGRKNVGKSTLFNALLGEKRAIVTPYPGTTRDFLREKMVIGDFFFNLVDMAGLGGPAHPVEAEGMRKGLRIAREADGLLIVLDGSKKESAEDMKLIRRFQGRKAVLVVNKADLPQKIDTSKILALPGKAPLLNVSALKGTRLGRLKSEIRRFFIPFRNLEEEIILHSRQRDLLDGILQCLKEARRLLLEGQPDEVCAEELRRAMALVGELVGEIRTDEVIGDIFKRFCVGK